MAVKCVRNNVQQPELLLAQKLEAVQKKLDDIQHRKEKIDRNQDQIDTLALRTISAMHALELHIDTMKKVCKFDQEMQKEREQLLQQLQMEEVTFRTLGVQTDSGDRSSSKTPNSSSENLNVSSFYLEDIFAVSEEEISLK